MFFKRQDSGRIYVIRMKLPDGMTVWKIGMTERESAVDRMMELLRSWFVRFRFVPYSELRLDMHTGYPKQLETHIHRILGHKRFTPHMKVEGRTEMFTDIDEFRVLHYLRTFNDDVAPVIGEIDEDGYAALGRLISP
jgi:hypothetical protein